MDRAWKLGDDLTTSDSILDGFTFDDIILAVRCNCRTIDTKAVLRTAREIMDQRLEDYYFILNNNVKEIIAEVKRQKEA